MRFISDFSYTEGQIEKILSCLKKIGCNLSISEITDKLDDQFGTIYDQKEYSKTAVDMDGQRRENIIRYLDALDVVLESEIQVEYQNGQRISGYRVDIRELILSIKPKLILLKEKWNEELRTKEHAIQRSNSILRGIGNKRKIIVESIMDRVVALWREFGGEVNQGADLKNFVSATVGPVLEHPPVKELQGGFALNEKYCEQYIENYMRTNDIKGQRGPKRHSIRKSKDDKNRI